MPAPGRADAEVVRIADSAVCYNPTTALLRAKRTDLETAERSTTAPSRVLRNFHQQVLREMSR